MISDKLALTVSVIGFVSVTVVSSILSGEHTVSTGVCTVDSGEFIQTSFIAQRTAYASAVASQAAFSGVSGFSASGDSIDVPSNVRYLRIKPWFRSSNANCRIYTISAGEVFTQAWASNNYLKFSLAI